MIHFKEYRLSELYEIGSGLSKSSDQFGYGHPFLSFSEIFNNYFLPNELGESVNSTEKDQEHCSIKRGDVFLTRTSETVEELGMSSVALKDHPKATFNGFSKRLRPKSTQLVDPRFIGYYLRGPHFRRMVTGYASLITRASLNIDIINRLKVFLPDLPIQRKIASILSTYDDLIENNNRRIRLLEEMAEEIYKEWFVRLRFPGWKESKFYDKDGKEVPHGTKGALPEGWRDQKVKEIANIEWGDTAVTKSSYVEKGFKAFSAAGQDGYLSYFDYDRNGIVLSAIGANCGRTYWATGKWSCIKNTIRFFSKHQPMDHYLFYATSHEDFFPKRGAAQPFISLNDAKTTSLLIPVQQIIENYERIIAPIFKEVDLLHHKNQLLQETRDLLLPRLISGKLSVEDIELPEPGKLSKAADSIEEYQT